MSIDCRDVHGNHGFCHCVMSHAGKTPERPLDGEWTRISAGSSVTAFLRAVYNLGQGEGRMTMGRLAGDGGLTSTMVRDLHGIYLTLSGAETVVARSAIVVQTDVPLTAVNLRNDEAGSHCDVWTAQGWVSTSDAIPAETGLIMRRAILVDGRYHYRALISGAGQGGLVLSADSPFAAVLHKAPVLVEKRTMRIAADSPGLHIILMRSMQDQTFPLGALLRITASDGTPFDKETITENSYIKREGRSVRAVFLQKHAAASYELEMVAIKGTGFHLLFQNAARADVLPTMREALKQIYKTEVDACCDHEHGDTDEAGWCNLCVIAIAAPVFTVFLIASTAIVGALAPAGSLIAAALGPLGLVASRVLLASLMAFSPIRILTAFCYMLGVCDASPEIRRMVDISQKNSQRYDQLCYLTTHNAFSYRTLITRINAQQGHSIRKQLDSGVDALMLDIWRHTPSEEAYLCHEPCAKWTRFFTAPSTGPLTLAQELTEVVAVLDSEKTRIITLLFESRLGRPTPSALVKKAFDDAKATKYLFYADRLNTNGSASWDVRTQGWPTRDWMIKNGFRLVVFSDRAADTWSTCQVRDEDGLPFTWEFAAETVYGDDSWNLHKPAKVRDCSKGFQERMPPLRNGEQRWPLLIMNYFPTFDPGQYLNPLFVFSNAYGNIGYKALQVADAAKRSPNFVAVDFFELGLNDGPFKVVRDANAAWSGEWVEATEVDAEAEAEAPA